MKQYDHSLAEAQLSALRAWQGQCSAEGLAAGLYFSVEGAGKGECYMINKKLGLLLNYNLVRIEYRLGLGYDVSVVSVRIECLKYNVYSF